MGRSRSGWAPRAALAVLAFASAGPQCAPFAGIRLFTPDEGMLFAQSAPVQLSGRIGKEFDPSTTRFAVDGVDLVAALGLVPPFTGQSGVVPVGPDIVTVTGFSYDPTVPGTVLFSVTIEGLSPADHALEVSSEKAADGSLVSRTRGFAVVAGFVQELATTRSAGLPGGPIAIGSSGVLANQSMGGALAAPPAVLSGAGTLRSGHVEAVEARIAVGGP